MASSTTHNSLPSRTHSCLQSASPPTTRILHHHLVILPSDTKFPSPRIHLHLHQHSIVPQPHHHRSEHGDRSCRAMPGAPLHPTMWYIHRVTSRAVVTRRETDQSTTPRTSHTTRCPLLHTPPENAYRTTSQLTQASERLHLHYHASLTLANLRSQLCNTSASRSAKTTRHFLTQGRCSAFAP